MLKGFRKSIVTVIAGLLIAVNAGQAPGAAHLVYAAQEEAVKTAQGTDELRAEFPTGTVLKSDSFEGLKVTYDGRDCYTLKSGLHRVFLEITILDADKANKGLPLLRKVFGEVKIKTKKGNKVTLPARIIGIDESQEAASAEAGSSEEEHFDSDDSGDGIYFFDHAAFFPVEKKEETKKEEEKKEEGKKEEEKEEEEKKEEEKEEEKKGYERTITIYMDGTDLESRGGSGTKNLLDMLEAEIPDNTKVIVITGGTKKWHMDDIETYRSVATNSFYPDKAYDNLTADEKARVNSKADELYGKYKTSISGSQMWEIVNKAGHNEMKLIRSFSDTYMVDPAFLTKTIDLSTEYAPAEKYGLIIWDHGNGFGGYGDDEFLGEWINKHPDEKAPMSNTISVKDLSQAIANTQIIKEGGKFDFIGFDACLMATYEVSSTLSKYADYYIASEEIEPGDGWDYKALFNSIGSNPSVSTANLGSSIVDSFLAQYRSNKMDESTLSVIDLKAVDKLGEALSSFALILVSEADARYYDILVTVGRDSHFGTRNGFNSSNMLDIKRFVTPFTDDNSVFSDALKKAGKDVLSALEGCVLVSKTNSSAADGGLSIYFPIQAFYERPDFKEGYSFFNYVATDMLGRYSENNVNSDYARMAAKLAVRSMAGTLIGGRFWKDTQELGVDDVFKVFDESPEWKKLIEYAEVDRNNPDDPVMKTMQQLIDDRIHAGKISIELSELESIDEKAKQWKYKDNATVTVEGVNAPVVGDRVSVRILFDNNDVRASLGEVTDYSSVAEKGDKNGVGYAKWSVAPFEQMAYTLNGQIASMYITEFKEDGGFYGYIPLAVWNNISDVAGTGSEDTSRTQYLVDSAKDNKVKTIRLYVECTFVNDAPEFKALSYNDFKEGEVKQSHPITDIADKYVEILGGADELYTIQETPGLVSLGTAYVDEKSEIDIGRYYTSSVFPEFYISDYFGNEYVLSDANLGKDAQGNDRGMDAFYNTIPKDAEYVLTWEESQKYAAQVRESAAKATSGAADDVAQQNDRQDALANAKGSAPGDAAAAQSHPAVSVAGSEQSQSAVSAAGLGAAGSEGSQSAVSVAGIGAAGTEQSQSAISAAGLGAAGTEQSQSTVSAAGIGAAGTEQSQSAMSAASEDDAATASGVPNDAQTDPAKAAIDSMNQDKETLKATGDEILKQASLLAGKDGEDSGTAHLAAGENTEKEGQSESNIGDKSRNAQSEASANEGDKSGDAQPEASASGGDKNGDAQPEASANEGDKSKNAQSEASASGGDKSGDAQSETSANDGDKSGDARPEASANGQNDADSGITANEATNNGNAGSGQQTTAMDTNTDSGRQTTDQSSNGETSQGTSGEPMSAQPGEESTGGSDNAQSSEGTSGEPSSAQSGTENSGEATQSNRIPAGENESGTENTSQLPQNEGEQHAA